VVRLNKRDAEALIATIDDRDALLIALANCLRTLLGDDAPSEPDWSDLVSAAANPARWEPQRTASLAARDLDALQDLATELNERRDLVR
jgi:hypothetical protein